MEAQLKPCVTGMAQKGSFLISTFVMKMMTPENVHGYKKQPHIFPMLNNPISKTSYHQLNSDFKPPPANTRGDHLKRHTFAVHPLELSRRDHIEMTVSPLSSLPLA
jgi:hypothetical protein